MSPSQLARVSTLIPPTPIIAAKFNFDRVQGLSKRALDLHVGLYETYVNEANSMLEQLHEFPRDHKLLPAERLQRDGLVHRFCFEHNGVTLHEAFFEGLVGPGSGPAASSVFSEALDISFGGFDQWQKDIVELAQTRGVGWVITFHSKDDNRLINAWVDDHTRGLLQGMSPIVAFDLWEHAYLLDFKPSQRSDYLKVLFDNIDWRLIEQRCA
jgi:Fe-Mn family superoxide dismutase